MYPLLFQIGPVKVYSFGVMMALGFIAGYFTVRAYLLRRGQDGEFAGSIFLAALIGGVAGGRLYYAIEHWRDLRADPVGVLLSTGGLTFYGGLIGGALAVAWIIHRSRMSYTLCADATGPGITIGYVFGRIGCQLSGDGDYGRPSSVPWAMSYPHGTVPTLERVHPTPVYDVLMCLPIFVLLLYLRNRPHRPGDPWGVFLVLTGVQRFIVEFWRRNPGVFHGLSAAQLISVLVIALGVATPPLFRAVDARRGLMR